MTVVTEQPTHLLATGEAARAIGVSRSTLARWAEIGLLTPAEITLGGHLRWDLAELRRQMRERRERDEDGDQS